VGLVTGILFLMQYENAGVRELSLNDSNFTWGINLETQLLRN
jgi:hypothetical protein